MMNARTTRSISTLAVSGALVLTGAPAAFADDSESTSQQESSFSAPIELGGFSIGTDRSSTSSSSESSSTTDEDGTSSTSSDEQESSSSSTRLGVGETQLDPGAAFSQQERTEEQETGDITEQSGSSTTRGSLEAPLRSEGLSLHDERESDSSTQERSTLADEDGTASSEQQSSESSSTETDLDTGGFAFDPSIDFFSSSAEESTDVGDIESTEQSDASSLEAASPFVYEGGAFSFQRDEQSRDAESSTLTDEEGTASSSSTEESESTTGFGGETGGFAGDPSLLLEQFSAEESDQLGDEQRTESETQRELETAFPFVYEGFEGQLDREQREASTSEDTVTDEDGTSTDREHEERSTEEHPSFAFDGFAGDLFGFFDQVEGRDEH